MVGRAHNRAIRETHELLLVRGKDLGVSKVVPPGHKGSPLLAGAIIALIVDQRRAVEEVHSVVAEVLAVRVPSHACQRLRQVQPLRERVLVRTQVGQVARNFVNDSVVRLLLLLLNEAEAFLGLRRLRGGRLRVHRAGHEVFEQLVALLIPRRRNILFVGRCDVRAVDEVLLSLGLVAAPALQRREVGVVVDL